MNAESRNGIAEVEPLQMRCQPAPLVANRESALTVKVSLQVDRPIRCWSCERPLTSNAKLIVSQPFNVREGTGSDNRIYDERLLFLLCPHCDCELARVGTEIIYQKQQP